MKIGSITNIMMPLMEIIDPGGPYSREKVFNSGQTRGRFSHNGRYYMAPDEVLTIATQSGCLLQVKADRNGQVEKINIGIVRDRTVEVTLNGNIED